MAKFGLTGLNALAYLARQTQDTHTKLGDIAVEVLTDYEAALPDDGHWSARLCMQVRRFRVPK